MRRGFRRRIVAPRQRRVAVLHGQLRRPPHRRPGGVRRRCLVVPARPAAGSSAVRLQRDRRARPRPHTPAAIARCCWGVACAVAGRRAHRRCAPGRRAARPAVLHLERQVVDPLAQVRRSAAEAGSAPRPPGRAASRTSSSSVCTRASNCGTTSLPPPACDGGQPGRPEIGPAAALPDLLLQRLHLLLQLVDLVAQCDLLAASTAPRPAMPSATDRQRSGPRIARVRIGSQRMRVSLICGPRRRPQKCQTGGRGAAGSSMTGSPARL